MAEKIEVMTIRVVYSTTSDNRPRTRGFMIERALQAFRPVNNTVWAVAIYDEDDGLPLEMATKGVPSERMRQVMDEEFYPEDMPQPPTAVTA